MNRKEKGIYGAGLILVISIGLFLSQTTFGGRVDAIVHDTTYDTRLRNEVTIVGIDDTSLQKIGAWPWKRDVFARTLEALYEYGARVVVFDVLFLEDRQGDDKVRTILHGTKTPTLFASKIDSQGEHLTSIFQEYAHVQHGIAHVYPNEDGKVRSIPLYQKDIHNNCYPSLSQAAFLLYTKQDVGECNTNPQWFLFQEKPPTTISLINVLEGNISEKDVKDKVIFIGSNSLDIEDHFISQKGEKIPGVYVHASIFTTLLNNSFLQPVSRVTYGLLLLSLLSYIVFSIFIVRNLLIQGVALCGGLIACVVIVVLGFMFHYNISLSILLFTYIISCIYTILFRYTVTERKNNYIKELFGQFVNPKVLAMILKEGNFTLGGEKKYITILFSDVRGFTTMTETLPPEKVVEVLNSYFEVMSPIIMDKDGVIDKYIGDAIMAFWNAPVAVSNHEEKAVRASLAMAAALKTIQQKSPLEIGIGLHAGEAIAGNIGSKKRINYTVIGDAVNACSRLEGLTKKYGVQIIASEQIKNAIQSQDIMWRSIDIVRVKGKSEVMKLYEPMIKSHENTLKIKNSEEAFSHYKVGNFGTAAKLYRNINDMYSTKMAERCEELQGNTPLSWSGVWDWDEK